MANELEWKRQGDFPSVLVFVHGFTGSHETWSQFIDLLLADRTTNSPFANWAIATFGYPSRLLGGWIPFWRGDPSIPHTAGLLKTACEAGALSGFGSYAFVAHSMGGLVVQRALLDSDPLCDNTSLFYMYGTPSLGAELSHFANWGQSADMKPGNPFLNTLRAGWSAKFGVSPPFTFRTVGGSLDQFIKPDSSLGPFPKETQAVVPGDHLSMIRCNAVSDLAVDLLAKGLLKAPFALGPIDAAAVAAEKSDFNEVIRLLQPRADALDDAAKVRLALALEMTGRHDDAIAMLARHTEGASTDVLGSLAGQLKRRWLLLREKSNADRALALYSEGYQRSRAADDHAQAFYHGINVAFLQLVYLGKKAEAQATAREVLEHCAKAPDDPWNAATVAEAKLILGDDQAAIAAYRQARAKLRSPRDLLSAYHQAGQVAEALNKLELKPALDDAFGDPKRAREGGADDGPS